MKIKDLCHINKYSISKLDEKERILYLDTSNLTENRIEALQEFVLREAPCRAQRKVQDKTILYSMVRPNLKHYGILNKPPQNLVVSTGFITLDIIDKNIVNPYYLYYYITQECITNYLHSIASNSVSSYPSINPTDLGNLNIKLPDIHIQNRVAKILKDIDDKIAVNREINRNLPLSA